LSIDFFASSPTGQDVANRSTIARAVSAGARSVVAGSSILNDDDSIAGNVAALRAAVHGEDADRLGAS
jgi:delta-aminolevulinic acid dehydratase/porphobilinogen synthase